MLTFPRAAIRAFRAIIRQGVAGRARGPAPPVTLIPTDGAILFTVKLPQVVVQLRVPVEEAGSETLVVPMDAFDAVEGGGADPVTLESKNGRRARLRWTDRGQPQTKEFELGPKTLAVPLPEEPKEWAAMPREFLAVLHEAGRSCGRSNGRYALDRIQLKGSRGEIVASDAQQAFLHGGFRFPFTEDLLVAALPLFGAAELGGQKEITLGRTETHLVLRIGPWTLYLVLDQAGRFPEIASVVPKATSAAILRIDDADAEEWQSKLPGAKDDPLTLDLIAGQAPVIRAGSVEVTLGRSTVTKGSARVAVDRRFFERALRLGCRSFQLVPDRPVVARGPRLLLLAAPLESEPIVSLTSTEIVPLSLASANTEPAPLVPIETPPPVLAPVEPIDPMAEAEALRIAFVEAGQRVGRLMAWFQVRRKEPKVLAKFWSGLQSLKLSR